MKKCFGLFLCLFILGCSNVNKNQVSDIKFECLGNAEEDFGFTVWLWDQSYKSYKISKVTNDRKEKEETFRYLDVREKVLIHIIEEHGKHIPVDKVVLVSDQIESTKKLRNLMIRGMRQN